MERKKTQLSNDQEQTNNRTKESPDDSFFRVTQVPEANLFGCHVMREVLAS